MNRKRLLLIGALSLILAMLVSMVVYRLLNVAVSAANRPSESIVVAAMDIAPGARIDEKDVRVVRMPVGDVPEGGFHSIAEVAGRGVVVPMARNEPVLLSKLAPEQAGAGLPALIPNGMRAVSVKVNEVVSVAGFVVPGSHVDVLLTGNPSRDNDPGTVTTTTVLEDVQVLAAGQQLQKNREGQPVNVPVITLLVSPQDAQKLTLASSEGRIQLSLRNPMDGNASTLTALRNATLYQIPAPKPPEQKKVAKQRKPMIDPVPIATYQVEVIRGDKKDVQKFTEEDHASSGLDR
jgi:pilus assembly protein CpaB